MSVIGSLGSSFPSAPSALAAHDRDVAKGREGTYGFVNYTSALAAARGCGGGHFGIFFSNQFYFSLLLQFSGSNFPHAIFYSNCVHIFLVFLSTVCIASWDVLLCRIFSADQTSPQDVPARHSIHTRRGRVPPPAPDEVWFNSDFHLESFFAQLPPLLRSFPQSSARARGGHRLKQTAVSVK